VRKPRTVHEDRGEAGRTQGEEGPDQRSFPRCLPVDQERRREFQDASLHQRRFLPLFQRTRTRIDQNHERDERQDPAHSTHPQSEIGRVLASMSQEIEFNLLPTLDAILRRVFPPRARFGNANSIPPKRHDNQDRSFCDESL